jgi:hypothetical protein
VTRLAIAPFAAAFALSALTIVSAGAQSVPLGYTIIPSGSMNCQNAAGAQNKAGPQSIKRRTYLSEKGRAFLLFNPSSFAEGAVIPINGSGAVTMPFHVTRSGATRAVQLAGSGSVRASARQVTVSYNVSRAQPWGDGSTVTVRLAGAETYAVDPVTGACTVQQANFSKHLSAGGTVYDDFSCRSTGPARCTISKGAAQ